MTEIEVVPLGNGRFGVQVAEGEQAVSSHAVSVPQSLLDELQLGEGDAERLVWESFRFLLEREKPNEILAEFSLEEIQRYFPEYLGEIGSRVSA